MCRHPFRCLLFVVVTLLIPSAVSAQLKRVGQSPTSATSAAVVVPGELPLLYTTQLLPVGPDNRLVGDGDAAAQSAAVLAQLKDVLRRHDLSLDRVVKLNLAAKNPPALETLQKTLAAAFGDHPPAVSIVVSDLSQSDALVALDAVAALPAEARDSVGFAKAAEPPQLEHPLGILPPGQRIYISGQAEPGDLPLAVRKTMESLTRTLESLNLTKAAIVEVKAFVNPMSRADEVRREIATFFDKLPVPPIVFIDWKFTTPIEIEVVAWGGEARGGDPLDYITPPFMKSSPVFSRIVRINHGPVIFVGGLHGPAGASPDEQITSIFDQLGSILKAADSDLQHLVKATYLCTEPTTIKSLGALRPKYYDPQRPPAASLSMISHTGRAETTITLDMIAVPTPKDPTP